MDVTPSIFTLFYPYIHSLSHTHALTHTLALTHTHTHALTPRASPPLQISMIPMKLKRSSLEIASEIMELCRYLEIHMSRRVKLIS